MQKITVLCLLLALNISADPLAGPLATLADALHDLATFLPHEKKIGPEFSIKKLFEYIDSSNKLRPYSLDIGIEKGSGNLIVYGPKLEGVKPEDFIKGEQLIFPIDNAPDIKRNGTNRVHAEGPRDAFILLRADERSAGKPEKDKTPIERLYDAFESAKPSSIKSWWVRSEFKKEVEPELEEPADSDDEDDQLDSELMDQYAQYLLLKTEAERKAFLTPILQKKIRDYKGDHPTLRKWQVDLATFRLL